MSEHDRDLLGAYALGVLDPDEVTAIDQHVASCAACRQDLAELVEMKDSLGEVPPEAFLDGPPEGGDLLLQRTLRAVRADKTRSSRQRLSLIAAGVVALATVAAGAGVLVGRGTESAPPQVLPPAPSATAPSTPVGVRTVSASDRRTGATINATVTPAAAGWVRVHADVTGIKAGKRCQLVVLSRNGTPVVAGSWLVSPKGEIEGTKLDGSAIVPPADVAAVQVVTFDNEKLVSAPV
jgi:anti-sigma factor RsiW